MDSPYVERQSSYLKSATSLHQLVVGLFKKKQLGSGPASDSTRQLKFIVRITLKNEKSNPSIADEQVQARLLSKLGKLESLIV